MCVWLPICLTLSFSLYVKYFAAMNSLCLLSNFFLGFLKCCWFQAEQSKMDLSTALSISVTQTQRGIYREYSKDHLDLCLHLVISRIFCPDPAFEMVQICSIPLKFVNFVLLSVDIRSKNWKIWNFIIECCNTKK